MLSYKGFDMTKQTYAIGTVCSGNTCRSPIAAAWLRESVLAAGRTRQVSIWTAGMFVIPKDVGVKGVEPEALLVAKQMGLSKARTLIQSWIGLHQPKPNSWSM